MVVKCEDQRPQRSEIQRAVAQPVPKPALARPLATRKELHASRLRQARTASRHLRPLRRRERS